MALIMLVNSQAVRDNRDRNFDGDSGNNRNRRDEGDYGRNDN